MVGIRLQTRRVARKIRDTIRSQYFSKGHVTVIKPSKGWRMLDLRELWAYRELLAVLALRDIKVRYQQTVLGSGWAVIQPLVGMVIFSIIFGRWAKIPSEGYPYPIFVYAALLPWTFFARALSTSGTSILGSANLITKVYFPRLVVPLASVASGLIDFFVSLCVMLLLMLYYGIGWHPQLLALPFLFLAVTFTALGVGVLFSALTVAYRDFQFLLPFLAQIWMYVTPIIFPVELVPQKWRWALYLNPMAGIIDGFRSSLLGKPFNWDVLGLSFGVAVAVFLIGVAYFERVERRFADII